MMATVTCTAHRVVHEQSTKYNYCVVNCVAMVISIGCVIVGDDNVYVDDVACAHTNRHAPR